MENIVKEFIELVSVDSASGKERAIADVVKGKLEALGFTVKEDAAGGSFGGDTGNLIAVMEGTLPGSIMFCSHLDRVADGYGIKVKEKDGYLVSDETTILAADDVSGLCAILDGVRKVKATGKAHPRIEVVFTVGEEAGLFGGKFLDLSQIKSKLCYVVDSPGTLGRLVNGAPGRAELNVEVLGKPAHAGNEPEKGINSAHILCHILDTLKDGRVEPEVVSNFPVINTNCTVCNVVCDKAWAKGEARSRNPQKLKDYVAYFEKHCQEAAQGTGATVNTKVVISFAPFLIPEEAPVIQLAKKALSKMGIPARVEQGGGGMDGNFFNARGLPALGVASGYARNHTKNESLELASFLQAGNFVQTLIELYQA